MTILIKKHIKIQNGVITTFMLMTFFKKSVKMSVV